MAAYVINIDRVHTPERFVGPFALPHHQTYLHAQQTQYDPSTRQELRNGAL